MLFGYTDWLLRPQTRAEDLPPGGLTWDDLPYDGCWPYNRAPINAFELLARAFGEADLVPEQLVETELRQYRALLVTGLVYLPRAAARALEDFVRAGGVLLTDGLPQRDEDGAPLAELAALAAAPVGKTIEIDGALCAHAAPLDAGQVVRFTQDLADTYAAAFERDDPLVWRRMEDLVRRVLFERGARPAARAENADIEVGLRCGRNCALLILVNHAVDCVATRTFVHAAGLPVGWIADPATGEEVSFSSTEDGIALDVDIAGRSGRALALYRVRPHANGVSIEQPEYHPGEILGYSVQVVDQANRPAPGHHVVEIEVTDPAGKRRRRYGGQRTTTDGGLRIEVPLAVNERPGVWEIGVYDRLTRRRSVAQFSVV